MHNIITLLFVSFSIPSFAATGLSTPLHRPYWTLVRRTTSGVLTKSKRLHGLGSAHQCFPRAASSKHRLHDRRPAPLPRNHWFQWLRSVRTPATPGRRWRRRFCLCCGRKGRRGRWTAHTEWMVRPKSTACGLCTPAAR